MVGLSGSPIGLSIDTIVTSASDPSETSVRSLPGAQVGVATQDVGQPGSREATTEDTSPKVLAKCGRESAGACGRGESPEEGMGDQEMSPRVIVQRVSINAVTIRVPLWVEGRKLHAT